jgi:uncharacterized surface protein with fasciclin (FAS1) repeats
MLNGVATVTTAADIIASNGVVYVVDKVIGLPTVTHALANPNFTSLVGALTGAGQPDFVTILSGTGPFTVFVLLTLLYSFKYGLAPGGIASVSAANLTKSTIPCSIRNILAATLTEGQIVTTLNTQTFTVQLQGRLKWDARNRIATIFATDVQCSNGVIHVLNDKVLLPLFKRQNTLK